MKKKLLSLISAALCLCMVLSACGGPASSDPSPSSSGSQSGDNTQDKTLTIATMTETTSLSPLYMGVYNYSMCTMLYETLLKYEDGEVKGNLAESYSFNEDGTVMTLTLRQGITFHDGAPFNAEAVKKNLDFMHSNPQYMACPGIYDIESVEATDEYTVTITYPHPYYAYAYDFCWPDVGGMQSPNQIVEGDFQTVQGYVGTGPYIYEEYVPGEYTRFVRNENYWGEAPYFDEIIARYIPDATSRLQALQTGEIDLVYGSSMISYQDYQQATALDGVAGAIAEKDTRARDIMLMHLELSPKHKADLLARGLSEERIEQNMYRTLPMSSSARRFLAGILSDFHNLEGVPGFYVDRGYWNILGHSGLLVPCRDRNGYIQGLQIRLDDETKPDRKYRWLSSRGKAHGTRSYSYIHVTGNIHARTAYLTEGGLKGDVASFLDHDALFLCFAGVTAIAGLKDALQSMENLEEVVVALDMDKLVNWRVRNALGKIMETVQSIPNLRVRLMNWNMTFKGVDDFYKARNEAASKGVNILDMTSNFITMRLESLWKQEYPEQDRGFIHTCEWEELTVPIDQLTAGKPADMKKAQYYLKLLWAGKVDFPPLVSVNGVVIDGLHRFWAYQQMGYQTVTVYQNKPWAMPTAA